MAGTNLHRLGVLVFAVLLGVSVMQDSVLAAPAPAITGTPIEAHYAQAGPDEVISQPVTDPRTGLSFMLYRPRDLGGRKHPIITWGNGTGATPAAYNLVLNHFASWGYVVIASTSTTTGGGQEILAGAKYLVARGDDAHSPFHGCLDTRHIAAVGHSQGAGGALNANHLGDGLITTTVLIGLTTSADLLFLHPDPSSVKGISGTVLYVGGALDVITPAIGAHAAYDRTRVPAAIAVRTLSEHVLLPFPTTGYTTAWLRYQLDGDKTAAGAFVGPSPELSRNPQWSYYAHKDLDAPSA